MRAAVACIGDKRCESWRQAAVDAFVPEVRDTFGQRMAAKLGLSKHDEAPNPPEALKPA